MGILDDDYGPFDRRRPPPLMPPGTVPPIGPYQSFNTKDWLAQQRAAPRGMDFGTGSRGFPPTQMDWKPAVDTPKQQDQLGPRPDVAAADVADTFSAKPSGSPPASFRPGQFDGGVATAFAKPFDSSRLDPVMASTVSPSTPTRTATLSPAEPPSRPAGLGILSDKPLSPQRPTGVPTATPPPSLVENAPQPPPRPAGLGDPAPAPAPTPAAMSAPTPPPIIPTSAIGSPIADFGKGGEFGNVAPGGGDDFGGGLGGSLGDGSDDLAFAGGGGGMDLAAGESGGGGDGGGGGGGGGLGGILGAIGGLAKGLGGGGGGGGSAPAPPVPVAKAPQLAPMAGDPAMAKRAQGAQQIMSGLLADPTLIDPRKKQAGLLA